MAEKLNLAKDSTMVACANILAQAIRKYAPYDSIKKTVRVGKSKGLSSGSRMIQVWVGRKWKRGQTETGAEFAAKAFDVGSGLHGKFQKTYTIVPVNKRALWFPYPVPKIYPGVMMYKKGDVIGITTGLVNHPGVEGTNYTDRAEKSVRKIIREKIKKDGVENLRLYLRTRFTKGDK